ncbi:YbhB/YbcL family Raf kinase inhibitor-like protein [Murimonas intestini]|uniref:YbhB/YbcL family Raf kinase inhibitor-like protein n=1 Tax=Murimonas intestini TaxID=1337051 RepID=UPI0011DC9FCF|nr:YbhB/YbcL family Raf kinase inhibitor-like protein [Murimonas intestini]
MEKTELNFVCTGMKTGKKIPIEYTGRGQNISPEFIIKNLLPNAKTLAITLEDLTHPIKKFTHWIIWNIPATDKIEKGIPAGKIVLGNAVQGVGYGFHQYAGPKPPKGKKHIYLYTIYALDCELNLSANSMKGTFLRRAKGHIIQSGNVIGEFE